MQLINTTLLRSIDLTRIMFVSWDDSVLKTNLNNKEINTIEQLKKLSV